MSLQVGDIYARLRLDNTDFNKKLKQAEIKIKNFGNNVTEDAKKVKKPLETTSNGIEKIGEKAKKVKKPLDATGKSIEDVGKKAKVTGKSITNSGDSASKAGTEAKGAGKGFNALGNEALNAGKNIDTSRRYFNQAELGLVSLGVALTTVGRQLDNMIAKPIINFLKDAIEVGTSTEEAISRLGFVFGDSADEIERFAKNLDKVGVSASSGLDYVSRFGGFLKELDFEGEDLDYMSKKMTTMVGDLSSFYDISHEQAYKALEGVLTKQTRVTRKLAINPSIGNLQEYMEEQGMSGKYSKLKEHEQAEIRIAYSIEGTNISLGDFEKTIKSTQNKLRQLEETMSDVKAGFFKAIQPELNTILDILKIIVDAFDKLPVSVKKVVVAISLILVVVIKLMVMLGPFVLGGAMILASAKEIGILFKDLGISLSGIGATASKFIPILGIIITVIVAVVKNLDLFKKIISISVERTKALWNSLDKSREMASNMMKAIKFIIDMIGKLITIIAGLLTSTVIEIFNYILRIANAIEDMIEYGRTGSSLLANTIGLANQLLNPFVLISELVETISDLFSGEWINSMNELNTTTLTIRNIFLSIILVVLNIAVFIKNTVEYIKEVIEKLKNTWNHWVNVFKANGMNIRFFIADLDTSVRILIAKIGMSIHVGLIEIGGLIKQIFGSAIDWVINSSVNQFNKLINVMDEKTKKFLHISNIDFKSNLGETYKNDKNKEENAVISAFEKLKANLNFDLGQYKLNYVLGHFDGKKYQTGADSTTKGIYKSLNEEIRRLLIELGLGDLFTDVADIKESSEKTAENTGEKEAGFFLDSMFGLIEKGSGFGLDTVKVKEDLKSIVRSEVQVAVSLTGSVRGLDIDDIGPQFVKHTIR